VAVVKTQEVFVMSLLPRLHRSFASALVLVIALGMSAALSTGPAYAVDWTGVVITAVDHCSTGNVDVDGIDNAAKALRTVGGGGLTFKSADGKAIVSKGGALVAMGSARKSKGFQGIPLLRSWSR
jgi:hypothetical protein